MNTRIIKKALIHIGRPDLSKPHLDLSVLQAFVKSNPDCMIIVIVDNEEQELAVGKKIEAEVVWPMGHPGALIIPWESDSQLIDLLCARMVGTVSWRVVGNGWYVCPDGHESSLTMMDPREGCPTAGCGKKLEVVKHNEERVKYFHKTILEAAVKLMGFDTRSGVLLNLAVSPMSNLFHNMVTMVGCEHAPALKLVDFFGKGAGKPAICVAAGPSMVDEIENLKRLSETHTIICVGRVFKQLRDAGVKVHYTVSCEMFDWDSAIFDDLGEVGDTILGYPAVVAPATLKKWTGKKLCFLDPESAILLGEKSGMSGGNSVAHHMYNFAAEVLGCEPIYLVGQDLAYTKPGLTHAAGSAPSNWPDEVKAQDASCHAEIAWGPCYGKGTKLYPECHRQPVFMQGGIVPVGPMEVMTSEPYKNFATLFGILVRRHQKKTYNACGGGLIIDGVPYLDLSEVK